MADQRPILVVDDDEDIREVLALALELRGYRVVAARDGAAALQAMSGADKPVVVLLDMMMPQLDGEAFVTAVRRDPSLRRIPIILLSGSRDVKEKAAELDTAAFLVKPISTDDLLAMLRTFIAGEEPTHDTPSS